MHQVSHIKQGYNECGPTSLAQLFCALDWSAILAFIKEQIVFHDGNFVSHLENCVQNNGFQTTTHVHDLFTFDPTWYSLPRKKFIRKLTRSKKNKDAQTISCVGGYISYLRKGGKFSFIPILFELLKKSLKKHSILIGFLSSYLYQRAKRKTVNGKRFDLDSCRNSHFVVVRGYRNGKFLIVDSFYNSIPFRKTGRYLLPADELITAIYAGEPTRDAGFMEIR